MHLGMPELIIILAVALLIFGPKKLPELGSAIGKAIRSFKKSVDDPGDSPAGNACPKCRLSVNSDARFCPSCGAGIVRKIRDTSA